jgi:hypothetical protein
MAAPRGKWSRSADHLFKGCFLQYAAKDFDGIVSAIDKINMLNWIYIDFADIRVNSAVRAEADKQITGPIGILSWPDGEMRLMHPSRKLRALLKRKSLRQLSLYSADKRSSKFKQKGDRQPSALGVTISFSISSSISSLLPEANSKPYRNANPLLCPWA